MDEVARLYNLLISSYHCGDFLWGDISCRPYKKPFTSAAKVTTCRIRLNSVASQMFRTYILFQLLYKTVLYPPN